MKKLPINSIKVGDRFRHRSGSVDKLIESIRKNGLLHPIVVTSDNVLIAGKRRLKACRELGWKKIPCTVIDPDDPRLAEADENRVRVDFTPSEAVAVDDYFKPKEREAAQERKGTRTDKKQPSANFAPGKSREKVAALTGYSHETIRKAREVKEAAEREPRKFKLIAEEMDRTGKVDPAYKKVIGERERTRKNETFDPLLEAAKTTYLDLDKKHRKRFRAWLRTVD